MASNLAFNIFARDVDASKTFDKVGDSAERLSRRLDGIGKGAASIGGHLQGLSGRLAGLGSSLVMSGAQLGLLAGSAATAASSVVGLVAAVAPAAGAVAAVPAAALLAQAALGTLKVAVSGVSDAFSAAMEGDAKEFAEALEELSPAARSVALEFQALVPRLNDLKASVQDGLFSQLQGQLTATADVLLGPLKTGMTGLSEQFGRLASEVLTFGQSSAAVNLVTGVFQTLKSEISDLESGTLQRLLQAIARFTESTLPAFDGLGESVNGLAQRFTDFLNKATESGKGLQWIQGALDVFKQLGAIAKDLGGILGGIFEAMRSSGTGALGVIGQILDKINAFVNSAKGQEILVTVFESLHRVGEALGPVIESVAGAMATLAPAIANVAVAFAPVISAIIDALAPALAALAPGLVAVGQALAQAFANPAVREALLVLGQAISDVLIAVSPLIPVLAELAAEVITKLAPHIPPLAAAFVKVVEAVLPLVPVLADVAVIIAEQLARAVEEIAPHLPDLVKSFGDLLTQLTPLIPELVTLALTFAPLIPVVTDIITILTKFVEKTMPAITGGLQELTKVVSGEVTKFKKQWDEFYEAAKKAVTAVADKIDEFVVWLRDLPAKVGRWVGEAKDAAVEKFTELVDWVRDLPTKIKEGLGDVGKLLYNSGRSIIQGLIDGLYSMLQNAYDAAADILRRIRDLFPFSPAKEGPFSGKGWVLYSGMSIAEGLAEGMARGGGMVKSAAQRIAELASIGTSVALTIPQVTAVPAPRPLPRVELAGQAAVTTRGGSLHIEHFHAAANQDPRDIAEQFYLLSFARGY